MEGRSGLLRRVARFWRRRSGCRYRPRILPPCRFSRGGRAMGPRDRRISESRNLHADGTVTLEGDEEADARSWLHVEGKRSDRFKKTRWMQEESSGCIPDSTPLRSRLWGTSSIRENPAARLVLSSIYKAPTSGHSSLPTIKDRSFIPQVLPTSFP